MATTYRETGRHTGHMLTDEDIANDVLSGLKTGCETFSKAALEAGSHSMYQLFSRMASDYEQFQRHFWHYLHHKGWYSLRWATESQIDELRRVAEEFERDVREIGIRGEHRYERERIPMGREYEARREYEPRREYESRREFETRGTRETETLPTWAPR